MEKSVIHRCKRCEKWVYDDSPMCPSCTKRHNEVYNHFIDNEEIQINLTEPIKKSYSKRVFFIITSVILLIFGGIVYYRFIYIDLESFPANYTVFEIDQEAYYQSELSLIEIEISELFAYIITIEDVMNDSTLISFFMHPNSKAKVDIPPGSYRINYSVGKKWESQNSSFGSFQESYRSEYIYFITEDQTSHFTLKSNGEILYQFNE